MVTNVSKKSKKIDTFLVYVDFIDMRHDHMTSNNKQNKTSFDSIGNTEVIYFDYNCCKQLIDQYQSKIDSLQNFVDIINKTAMWGLAAHKFKYSSPNKQDYINLFKKIINYSNKLYQQLNLLEQYNLAPKKMLLMKNDDEGNIFKKLKTLNDLIAFFIPKINIALERSKSIKENNLSPKKLLIQEFGKFYLKYTKIHPKQHLHHNSDSQLHGGKFYGFILEILKKIHIKNPSLKIFSASPSTSLNIKEEIAFGRLVSRTVKDI